MLLLEKWWRLSRGSALEGSKIQKKPFAQHPAHLVPVGLEAGTVWDEDPGEMSLGL